MFHCKNEKLSAENSQKILRKAFLRESADKKLIFKVDFKVIWLYLFGYKISKVKFWVFDFFQKRKNTKGTNNFLF